MNIIPSFCKLNRFFRREMHNNYHNFLKGNRLTDDELDDLDNAFAGCAFE